MRAKDVAHEIQKREESLLKLTTQEREIRKRTEDIVDQDHDNHDHSRASIKYSYTVPPIGKAKANGEQPRKGKKKKA